MDEKTKLYVFAKKEVFLIFVFMFLISIISFTLGVKIGEKHSLKTAGITEQDQQRVEEMLSTQEEKIEDVIQEEMKREEDNKKEKLIDRTYEKLKVEYSDLEAKENSAVKSDDGAMIEDSIEQARKQKIEESSDDISQLQGQLLNEVVPEDEASLEAAKSAQANMPVEAMEDIKKRDTYSGKYTIQIGAYRTLKEAEEFANGFRLRGYNPIINEVEHKDRGIWYRVSLGVFAKVSDAKKYILDEKSLFEGQEYFFTRFD